MFKRYKPGPGWRSPYRTPVYEHASGARLHAMGLLILPGGREADGMSWPESSELERYVRACGVNRKRGVMAWAMEHIRRMEAMCDDSSIANH